MNQGWRWWSCDVELYGFERDEWVSEFVVFGENEEWVCWMSWSEIEWVMESDDWMMISGYIGFRMLWGLVHSIGELVRM